VAGLHIPLIPFWDVVANTGTLLPEHVVKEFPILNLGSTLALTVTINVVPIAHCPLAGINV
jgi:hypothetical protein